MKTTKGKSKGIPLDEIRIQRMRDPKRAKLAMDVALEEFEKDNDVDALLDTLRLLAQSQGGGLAALARKASISRQSLNTALSTKGNPKLRTFQSVLGSLGLRMSLKPVRPTVTLH